MILQDILIKPEKITLEDGRKGFFFQGKIDSSSTLILRRRKKTPINGKLKSKVGQAIITSLREVKKRKSSKDYPSKTFDKLVDEL